MMEQGVKKKTRRGKTKQRKKQKTKIKKKPLGRRVWSEFYLRLCDSSLTSKYRYSMSQVVARVRFKLKVKVDSDG